VPFLLNAGGQFSQIQFAWCETRWRGRQGSSAAALLELFSAPARARLIAPDLLSGDSGCGDTSFRRLTEFGGLAFASLLFADIGQPFEHIAAIPHLVDGKPFSQNLFGSLPVP
jgi:hypothetical protein